MIRYRPFRNCDPPAIAEIWRSHPPLRRLAAYLSPAQFEQHVLSKPYFDREGLILAVEEQAGGAERAVGFAHAGFGGSADGGDIDRSTGAICLVMTAPHADRAAIAAELLARSERYLIQRGAQTLLGGGIAPVNPFYLGLYGGSELPGTLASDAAALELFQQSGYRETNRCLILQLELAGYRPEVSRQQMQIRRAYKIEAEDDPPPATWWEACTLAHAERTRYSLLPRTSGAEIGSGTEIGAATFWNIDPLSANWGVHAAGMLQVAIAEGVRRQGLATFLIGESLRQMQAQGITLVEVQVMQDNPAALCLFRKLGFHQVDEGVVLTKTP